jgi:hypothetical protein
MITSPPTSAETEIRSWAGGTHRATVNFGFRAETSVSRLRSK